MVLVPSFAALLEPFTEVMTRPTFQSFTDLVAGGLLAGRHTITGALKLAGHKLPKHFSSYHRVFSQAHWDLDPLGVALLALLLAFAGPVVYLVIDDTLCRHRGRKIWGAGMHYDPALTGRALSLASRANAPKTLKRRGHAWVVLGIVLRFGFFPGHCFCLPVFFRLYLNRKTAARCRRTYCTRTQRAVELLRLITARFPQVQFHVLVDSAYAGQVLLQGRPEHCQVTARWIANPALYGPVPDPVPGQKGRPRKHGPRLDGVATLLEQRAEQATLDVYGKHTTYRLVSILACFYATPNQLLKIVAAEPLSAAGHRQAEHRAVFYSTDLTLTPAQVIEVYAQRWSLEVSFHDTKGGLGLEEPQGWCRQSVQRQAPVLLLLYSLVVLWFARHGHRRWRPIRWPWYPAKTDPSFLDMLTSLRQATLRYRFRRLLRDATLPPGLQKAFRGLLTLWKRAA